MAQVRIICGFLLLILLLPVSACYDEGDGSGLDQQVQALDANSRHFLWFPFTRANAPNYCVGGDCYSGHRGVDYLAPNGTPVYAVMDGTAECPFNSSSGYGHYVAIHNGPFYITLAHLQQNGVASCGQTVQAGKTIVGFVGKTGASGNTYHLHLDLREGGWGSSALPTGQWYNDGLWTDPLRYGGETEQIPAYWLRYWNFDNANGNAGWATRNAQHKNYDSKSWGITAGREDPGVQSPDSLNLKPRDYNYVAVQLKSFCSNRNVRLYYKADGKWKSIKTTLGDRKDVYYWVTFDVRHKSNWWNAGRIDRLRIDPADNCSSNNREVRFDYISLQRELEGGAPAPAAEGGGDEELPGDDGPPENPPPPVVEDTPPPTDCTAATVPPEVWNAQRLSLIRLQGNIGLFGPRATTYRSSLWWRSAPPQVNNRYSDGIEQNGSMWFPVLSPRDRFILQISRDNLGDLWPDRQDIYVGQGIEVVDTGNGAHAFQLKTCN